MDFFRPFLCLQNIIKQYSWHWTECFSCYVLPSQYGQAAEEFKFIIEIISCFSALWFPYEIYRVFLTARVSKMSRLSFQNEVSIDKANSISADCLQKYFKLIPVNTRVCSNHSSVRNGPVPIFEVRQSWKCIFYLCLNISQRIWSRVEWRANTCTKLYQQSLLIPTSQDIDTRRLDSWMQ